MPSINKESRGSPSLTQYLQSHAPVSQISDEIPWDRYLMSARLILLQIQQYRLEKNDLQLYVFLMRFVSLIITTIPKHKDHKQYVNTAKYQNFHKMCQPFMEEMEALNIRLKTRNLDDIFPQAPHRPADVVPLSASNLPQIAWSGSSNKDLPQRSEPQVSDLLDILAGTKIGVSIPPAPTIVPSSSAGPTVAPSSILSSSFASSYATSANLNSKHALFYTQPRGTSSQLVSKSAPLSTNYSLSPYPVLADSSEQKAQYNNTASSILPSAPPLDPFLPSNTEKGLSWPLPAPTAGPLLGPQEVQVHSVPYPGADQACCLPSAPLDTMPSALSVGPTPGGPKQLVKQALLREVQVSVALMEDFLRYAERNTRAGIESCGILAGKLSGNDSVFTITTLIIPKQQGTSDTVQALNEEDIFDAQFQRELYPLGWIHTHPSQTCFLSSIDIHTQCGYQTMLDEALAIVMAPTDLRRRCGIFRLTTPGGLKLVQKCALRGFHMHPPTETGQEVYDLCGHVYLNDRVKHEVLDLR